MKKLMLMGAFLLSAGAFAQIHPDIPKEPCRLIISENLSPSCWPFNSFFKGAAGTFDFLVCGSLAHQSSEEIEAFIFDYLCKNQTLPSGVTVLKFYPATISEIK